MKRALFILAIIILVFKPQLAMAYPFGLSAPAVLPTSISLQASVDSLDFGQVSDGEYVSRSVTISNPTSSTYDLWVISQDPIDSTNVYLDIVAPSGYNYSRSNNATFTQTVSNSTPIVNGAPKTFAVKLKALGNGTFKGYIAFGENGGNDVYVAYKIERVAPPSAPPPPLPYKPTPDADISLGVQTYDSFTDTVAIRLLSEARAFEEDTVAWFVNGVLISHDRHPKARLKAGSQLIRLEITEKGTGKLYAKELACVLPTPPPTEPEAFVPPTSGYHPRPEPRTTSETSVLVKTKRRAKLAGVEEKTWGWIKNEPAGR